VADPVDLDAIQTRLAARYGANAHASTDGLRIRWLTQALAAALDDVHDLLDHIASLEKTIETTRVDLHAQIGELDGTPPDGDAPPLAAYIIALGHAADQILSERDETRDKLHLLAATTQRIQAHNTERMGALLLERDAESRRIRDKLEAGTLHVIWCNADHDGPVGGDSCSCPTGRTIQALRQERDVARAKVDVLRTAALRAIQQAWRQGQRDCDAPKDFCPDAKDYLREALTEEQPILKEIPGDPTESTPDVRTTDSPRPIPVGRAIQDE
jgi:hypothetical protein